MKMFSNDIQSYSTVLAKTCLNCYRAGNLTGESLVEKAAAYVEELRKEI
ncbi:hypothetical protein OAG53_02745 [Akkermansiaceae bacterium]|nr:hypothetical protein [Akkermansiaceae bacterium]